MQSIANGSIGVKISQEYTELHPADPLPKQSVTPQAEIAIGIIEKTIMGLCGAKNALRGGCDYNANGTDCNDYFPNGFQDYVVRVFEPLLRLHTTKRFEQGKDVIGYVALFVAWMQMGCPDGQFINLIKHLYPEQTKWLEESGQKQKLNG